MLNHDLLTRAAAIIRNNAEALREGHTVGGKFDEGDEAQAVVETEISVAAKLEALASRLQEQEGQPALSDEQIERIATDIQAKFSADSVDEARNYDLMLCRAAIEADRATLAAGSVTDAIQQAIRDYHYALDTRQHGGAAADRAFTAIREALGMGWVQGAEARRRASPGGDAVKEGKAS